MPQAPCPVCLWWTGPLGTPDPLGNQSPQNVNHFATALGTPGQGSPLPASTLLQPKNGVCAGAPLARVWPTSLKLLIQSGPFSHLYPLALLT